MAVVPSDSHTGHAEAVHEMLARECAGDPERAARLIATRWPKLHKHSPDELPFLTVDRADHWENHLAEAWPSVRERAAKVEVQPVHWVHGADEGISYCAQCIEAAVVKARKAAKVKNRSEIFADGGWTISSDCQEFCHSCGAILDNSYTDHGAEEELSGLEDESTDSDTDCYIAITLLDYHEDGALADRLSVVLSKLTSGGVA